MALTPQQVAYLNVVDNPEANPARAMVDDEQLRQQARAFLKRYQMPEPALAALLLELGAKINRAVERAETGGRTEEELAAEPYEPTLDDFRRSMNVCITEIAILAATITRRQRGKLPL